LILAASSEEVGIVEGAVAARLVLFDEAARTAVEYPIDEMGGFINRICNGTDTTPSS
jgi:hypothetical protein